MKIQVEKLEKEMVEKTDKWKSRDGWLGWDREWGSVDGQNDAEMAARMMGLREKEDGWVRKSR